MSKLYDLARMTTATVGTGTITLGSPVSGFLSFAAAGASNGDDIAYAISDGANSEIGHGTYSTSGTTLTRTVLFSTNANAAISLSGNAQVFITPSAEGLASPDKLTTPLVIGGAATSSTLTLESTSGAGTTDEIIFQTGSQAQAGFVNTSQQWTLGPSTATPPTGGVLSISKNTGTLPLASAGTLAYIANADGNYSRLALIAAGSTNFFGAINYMASRGTMASPTATQSGDILGANFAFGYGTSYQTGGGAGFVMSAAQTFTGSNGGAQQDIYTTPLNTTSFAVSTRFQPSGGVSIGSTAAATDPGLGNLLLQGFVNTGGYSRVTSDFSVTSNSTLGNVTGLTATLIAGATYAFEAYLFCSTPGDTLKAAIAGTATATNVVYQAYVVDGPGIAACTQATALGTTVVGTTTGTSTPLVVIAGTITVNAAGTLTVQFAQNISSGTAAVVKRGSWFKVWQIT
jgi:hypothetical protein